MKNNKIIKLIVIILLLLLFVASIFIVRFSIIKSFINIPTGFIHFFDKFLPNVESLNELPRIVDSLLATILVAIAASVLGGLLGLILAFFIADSTKGNTKVEIVISKLIEYTTTIVRNIPIIAWLIIILVSFGQSEFSGFLTLFIYTTAVFTRVFTELINESTTESTEALISCGASRLQLIFCSIIPSIKSSLIHWYIYSIETNIRSATIVGVVSGSGIGFWFNYYRSRFMYRESGLIIISIVIVILLLERVSTYAKKVFA